MHIHKYCIHIYIFHRMFWFIVCTITFLAQKLDPQGQQCQRGQQGRDGTATDSHFAASAAERKGGAGGG